MDESYYFETAPSLWLLKYWSVVYRPR